MKIKTSATLMAIVAGLSFSGEWTLAKNLQKTKRVYKQTTESTNVESNILDEWDPEDPQVEQKLRQLDAEYGDTARGVPFSVEDLRLSIQDEEDCYRETCRVFALVLRSEQKMYLYVDGQFVGAWDTSTGVAGSPTLDFDQHPNGRIYNAYTSKKHPGGDYNGLGNMPYAVFIEGGYAIHGTAKSNWKKLGRPASHGCVRIHPDNAAYFNQLVRDYGVRNTWISVQE